MPKMHELVKEVMLDTSTCICTRPVQATHIYGKTEEDQNHVGSLHLEVLILLYAQTTCNISGYKLFKPLQKSVRISSDLVPVLVTVRL